MANQFPRISFIIPVFNVEQYLEKCFHSILKQSSGDWEIIAINDGSTDHSLRICLNYQERYSNIKVISQVNSGQGCARNIGLENASGEYVCFVDADDWVESTLVEELVPVMEKSGCDFLNFGLDFLNPNGKVYKKINRFKKGDIKGVNIFRDALLDRNIYTTPCNKIYKKSFLIENNIYFPLLKKYEDIFYSRLMASKSSHCTFVSKIYYHALIRCDSTTRSMDIENIKSALHVISMEKDHFFPDKALFPDFNDIFQSHCLKFISGLIIQAAYRIEDAHDYYIFYKNSNITMFLKNSNNYKLLRHLKLKNFLIVKIIKYPTFIRFSAKFLNFFGFKPY